MLRKIWPATLLALFLTGGCGNDDDEDNGPERDAVQDPVDAARNELQFADLTGNWISDCRKSELLGSSMKITYEIRGDGFEERHAIFNDEECKDLGLTVAYTGKYTAADAADAPEVDKVRTLDFSYQTAALTVNTELGETLLSGLDFCGQSNYDLNQTVDLSAASAEEGCPLKDVPSTRQDLAGTRGETLFLGSGYAAASETPPALTDDERPEKLNMEEPFRQQRE